MRTPCKYMHEATYKRWVDGALIDVTINECWGEKEPSVCDARRMGICGEYKPISCNDKLSWIPTDKFDDHSGYMYKCARCGKKIIGTSNYCPRCGHEYKPWDGTIFR